MKRIGLTVLGLWALSVGVNAADIEAYLDSTNGSSVFVALDADSNVVLSVKSDGEMSLRGTLSVSNYVNRNYGGFRSVMTIGGGDDVEIGSGANGYDEGAAVGRGAKGQNGGAAVGQLAKGQDHGAALGYLANGEVSWTLKVLRNDPACQEDLRQRPVEQLKSRLSSEQVFRENGAVNTLAGFVGGQETQP